MPFDPDNPVKSLKTVKDAVRYARKKSKPFIDFRASALRDMVGTHYGDNSHYEMDKTPVNEIAEVAQVLPNAIAAKNPAVMVTTFQEGLLGQAHRFKTRLNRRMKEMKFARQARKVLVDSLFGLGILKTGVSIDAKNMSKGNPDPLGSPYGRPVSLADAVIDMSVKEWDDIDFMGDRCRKPVDEFFDNPLYNQDAARKLKSTSEWSATDRDGIKRDEALSLGEGSYEQRYRPRVDIYEVWFPDSNLVVTFNMDVDLPLRVVPFDGLEGGPYRRLSFQDVPGQLMPLAPIATLADLASFVNVVYRKIMRQAARQKEVFTYQGEHEDTLRKMWEAADGEGIRTDVSDPVQRHKFGGADPQTIATAIHSRQLFSRKAGNLDLLAGIAPQADTARAEMILNQNASQRVQDMQERFVEFVTETIQHIAWYEWTDPLREETVQRRIGNTSYFVTELWSPETREGDFIQYDINIEPFSMQRQSPSAIVSLVMQMLDRAMAMGPVLASQGITIDVAAAFDLVSRYTNRPEIKQVIRYAPKQAEALAGMTQPSPSRGGSQNGRQVQGTDGMDDEGKLLMRLLSGAGESNTVGTT